MSDSVEKLRRKIEKAGSLGSVVSTMKTLAATNIRQYEAAVSALGDYYRTVELGLSVCFRQSAGVANSRERAKESELKTIAVVFGSDQGLIGQFNGQLVDTVRNSPELRSAGGTVYLSVGERIQASLLDSGLETKQLFRVPNSVNAITPLVGELLSGIEKIRADFSFFKLILFYNSPVTGGIYRPVTRFLLPLDEAWEANIRKGAGAWPGKAIPEMPNGLETTRWALLREYLFVSLFRACAESLASENASRLAAMQRAEKNIDELLDDLTMQYNQRRQADIDEELFDVIAGFQALKDAAHRR
ncbi:MAG: F0F1 ATP synthase subunit gamma [Chlorobaculum sp.]|nr:F0F1 ATP synthase subunit gamma [Chlorobaculum sp.]